MKIYLGSVLLLFLLVFTGCGAGEQELKETTEFFGSYNISPSGALKFDGYGYLHFFSAETCQWMYLCNKPGCLHNDSSCGAFWGADGLSRAFFYDGDLYVIHQGILSRANAYGEERRDIGETGDGFYRSLQLDSGILYYISEIWDAASDSTEVQFRRIDLSNGKCEELPQPDSGHTVQTFQRYYLSGDDCCALYICSDIDLNDFFDKESGTLMDGWQNVPIISQLYRTNLTTGESELILEREKPLTLEPLALKGRVMTLVLDGTAAEFNLDTREITPLADMTAIIPGGDDWSSFVIIGDRQILSTSVNTTNELIFLDNWQVTARLDRQEGWLTPIGKCGDKVFFNCNDGVAYLLWEDLVQGRYDFHISEGNMP